MLNLGTIKMPYVGIFGLENLRTIVIFEISNLKFVKHESLTHTMDFGIGNAFSKGLGSAFSEGPGVCFVKYAEFDNNVLDWLNKRDFTLMST